MLFYNVYPSFLMHKSTAMLFGVVVTGMHFEGMGFGLYSVLGGN
jgi:hypothetical protein